MQSTFIVGLLLAMPLPALSLTSEQFDLKTASDLQKHHQVRQSLLPLNRAIARNPGCREAYVMRARANIDLENRAQALADINKAIAINPNFWHDYDIRARIKYEENDIEGAIEDEGKGLRLAPREESLFRFRAKMYTLAKKDDKAIADLTSAIANATDKHDKQYTNYRLRGDIYYRQKKFQQAINDYTSALDVATRTDAQCGSLEKLYSVRANAYQKLGKKDLAAKDRARASSVVKGGWGAFLED